MSLLFRPLDEALQRLEEVCAENDNLAVLMKHFQKDIILAEVKRDNLQCCICLERLIKGKKERMLPCTHLFHRKCISDWLKVKRECPICKLKLN
jgi:hypothetical protein